MTNEMVFKTGDENYKETLEEARKMTVHELKVVLKDRLAFHSWAVKAYEKALAEKAAS